MNIFIYRPDRQPNENVIPDLCWTAKGHQHNFQLHSMGNRLADLLAKRGVAKYIELQKVLTKQR